MQTKKEISIKVLLLQRSGQLQTIYFRPENCSVVYYPKSANGAGYYEEDEEDD